MKWQNRKGKSKIVIGLTGGFGCGKTTVAGIFRSCGAKIVDADKIAHEVIRPASAIYTKIIRAFGTGILKKNKAIDRERLAGDVFGHKDALKKLNNIVHPEVIRIIKKEIKASAAKLVVLDAPLLIEAGLLGLTDKLVVVSLSRRKQTERIINRTSLARADISKRIKAQIPLAYKIRMADFIIDNNGTIGQTRKQVAKIWRLLWKK